MKTAQLIWTCNGVTKVIDQNKPFPLLNATMQKLKKEQQYRSGIFKLKYFYK